MPPIFVGATDGYTKATAETSRRLADEQIFGPERAEFDWEMNNVVLPRLGARYWLFESNTPNVTDNRELVSMLSVAERTGGITPRLSRKIITDVFPAAADGIPAIDPEKFDPDLPFSLTVAEKVKNQGEPTEMNQVGAPTQSARGTVKSGGDDYLAGIRRLIDVGHLAASELKRLHRVPDDDSDKS